MGNVGKKINDFFCQGQFGRRYDLQGAVIVAEGLEWIVIRVNEHCREDTAADFTTFKDGVEKQAFIDKWTNDSAMGID